ncbi:uncharacterized protein LOC125146332 isoform X2 [Tachysurus fulvidraco]|uniref:uncharacterized protein LOC125146332 isoform X2 n=1 Tax=Tachysurus fulvidraco TaxID=1234273 RepID=UPI001FED644B|nr:uncharacterized protein LOC125146332 isoform X2 [Tachysurus fulvidraco]
MAMQTRSTPPKQCYKKHKVLSDSFTHREDEDAGNMKLFTAEEALQVLLDSEEEFAVSSDEEQDSDVERLYFEERLDSAEDIISEENVAVSISSSPAPAATLSPSFDARMGARSNENNKENVSATRSPSSDTRTRARSNATDIHPVNVAATRSPSSDTRTRARSKATVNKKKTKALR